MDGYMCEMNGGMYVDTCVKGMEGCMWIHVLREWRDVYGYMC